MAYSTSSSASKYYFLGPSTEFAHAYNASRYLQETTRETSESDPFARFLLFSLIGRVFTFGLRGRFPDLDRKKRESGVKAPSPDASNYKALDSSSLNGRRAGNNNQRHIERRVYSENLPRTTESCLSLQHGSCWSQCITIASCKSPGLLRILPNISC